eukprot:s2725_g2.t1
MLAEQIIGSLFDSSTRWFASTLALAKEASQRHQQATPLERLTISPVIPSELTAAKWSCLGGRVMTMLLTAMPKVVKEDAVASKLRSPPFYGFVASVPVALLKDF